MFTYVASCPSKFKVDDMAREIVTGIIPSTQTAPIVPHFTDEKFDDNNDNNTN